MNEVADKEGWYHVVAEPFLALAAFLTVARPSPVGYLVLENRNHHFRVLPSIDQ
jgi:hypothetical protein